MKNQQAMTTKTMARHEMSQTKPPIGPKRNRKKQRRSGCNPSELRPRKGQKGRTHYLPWVNWFFHDGRSKILFRTFDFFGNCVCYNFTNCQNYSVTLYKTYIFACCYFRGLQMVREKHENKTTVKITAFTVLRNCMRAIHAPLPNIMK